MSEKRNVYVDLTPELGERLANELRAMTCTCGMAEQERQGHAPQHQDWCEVEE